MKFAIYGFYFKQYFSFNDFTFIPVKHDVSFWDEVKISKDKYQYNLTGYIETSEIDREEFIFNMQAVLTFVQQQDVLIKDATNSEVGESYESDFERRGTGAPFATFFELQTEIVEKLYLKLIDNKDLCNLIGKNSVFDEEHNAEFKSLVFKVTEPFHMRRPFVEMSYFLYFSGLESFCKQYLSSYFSEIKIVNDASKNFAQMLEKMEINYIQVDTEDSRHNLRKQNLSKELFLKLSLSTYSNLRNKLFHQNLFVAETECSLVRNADGKYQKEKVKITDYEYYLHRLCNVVILKYIGIQNKKLDCSNWYTRFPLIS